MTKIIANPDRLINAFAATFGEHNRAKIAEAFAAYTTDAVIAVTVDDITDWVISWADDQHDLSCEEFHGVNFDESRYYGVKGNLESLLDTEAIIDRIESEWENDFYLNNAIEDAMSYVYDGMESVLEMVVAADNRYLGGINA
jgi:hypothetical protein